MTETSLTVAVVRATDPEEAQLTCGRVIPWTEVSSVCFLPSLPSLLPAEFRSHAHQGHRHFLSNPQTTGPNWFRQIHSLRLELEPPRAACRASAHGAAKISKRTITMTTGKAVGCDLLNFIAYWPLATCGWIPRVIKCDIEQKTAEPKYFL